MRPPITFGERLNPAQYHAATYGGPSSAGFSAGPLLIIAGAGTGKTNTLAHRVAHLLLNGVAPERILLLTFTRRAAQEMLRRAERIAHDDMRERAVGARISTPRACSGPARSIRSAIGCCASTRRSSGWSRRSPCSTAATRRICSISCARSSGSREEREALSAQGHVPRDLFPPRQQPPAARAHARRSVSLVQRVGRRADATVPPLRRGQARATAARLRRSAAVLAHPRCRSRASRARSASASSTC